MTMTYRNHDDRLRAAGGAHPDLLGYGRKSITREDRQIASLAQQRKEVHSHFSVELPDCWWWLDSMTGTTFDRPAFQDLLAYCRAHKRSLKNPGLVLIYDPSRFGRVLDELGKPDVLKYIAMVSAFWDCGWKLRFVTLELRDDPMLDAIMIAMHACTAAQYSINQKNNARRGRKDHTGNGWWTAGGAPFGTIRVDTRSNGPDGKPGRVLAKREQSTPGGGGVILAPDESLMPYWNDAARWWLEGASLHEIGKRLKARGVVGPRKGNALGHTQIRNFLTSRVLIGEIEYSVWEGDRRVPRVAKAQWEPMVDLEVFAKVQARFAEHALLPEGRKRRKRDVYPLRPVCLHCGLEFTGGRLSKVQGQPRVYVHGKPPEHTREDAHSVMKAAGCKVWTVDADELEGKVKDVIVAHRASADFEREVREKLLDRDAFDAEATKRVHLARAELRALEERASNLARALGGVGAGPMFEKLLSEAQLVGAEVARAKSGLAQAEEFAVSAEASLSQVADVIADTRSIAEAWGRLGLSERKLLLDYWVLDVGIIVEPVPGYKRGNFKTGVVLLSVDPNTPKDFKLRRGQPLKADRSSRRTSRSVSTASRSARAARADGVPILPSAQAAWLLTSGSGSESAATSEGTSSGEPTLPRTTAALRLSPLSLARLVGERLNAAENSGCDMASSSRASVRASRPAMAGRGANGESAGSARENFMVNGQTSWEICRHTHIAIPLGTGARTVRSAARAPTPRGTGGRPA